MVHFIFQPTEEVTGGGEVMIKIGPFDFFAIDAGWMVILAPENWDRVKITLTLGSEVGPKYETIMDTDSFEGCG